MANEIQYAYTTGSTLTYGAYQPDGTVRTAAGTALAEVAGTGYYKATNASVLAGDFIVVIDSVAGVIGGYTYRPEVTTTDLSDAVDLIATDVDTLLSYSVTVHNVYVSGSATPGKTVTLFRR